MAKSPKLIVLTGATRGLGRAMLDGFIKSGARVASCGRDSSQIDELRQRYGDKHHFSLVDVSDNLAVAGWASDVLANVGTPDFLINNAGIINKNAPLWEVPVEEFNRVVDINIKGVYSVLRHFLPSMVKRKKGVIINFSSGWGRSSAPQVAPYCATKYAIEGLTQALAQELPAGMAAIPFNPGVIDTDMLRSCFGASAMSYPSPARWAERAVPFLLALSTRHNGQPTSLD